VGSIFDVSPVNLLRESECRVSLSYNLCAPVEESSKVTMSSLSITTLFSLVSEGPSRERPLAIDVNFSDAKNTEESSRVVSPVSMNDPEPTVSSSSSQSAYDGEETREAITCG